MHPDITRFPLGSIDTHVHTKHSCDSDMEPAEAVNAALKHGLSALVFTEHVDFDPTDGGYGYYDPGAIRRSLDQIRNPKSEIRIFRGVEITYQPQYERTIRDFISAGKFDFVIGSVHLVGPDDISRPEKQEQYYRSRTRQEAYGAYLADVEKLVASGLFDCLGHMDMCKRYGHQYYGPMSWRDFGPQIARILRSVIKNDMVIELNTSGLRQDPRETYPSCDVIREYFALGGTKLALGSDAHVSEHVGYRLSDICGILNAEYRI